ncbi:MAG: pro-sigmaK processing inhibitor BofA [Firmicutes bacterium]|jgi:inhibitor of the pro-sigma K processing machinery|nr:pro-sigmaK processing inhibitor BofA [Bacillota bacterium]
MPEIGLNTVIAAIFGLLVLYYLFRLLAAPARLLLRVLLTGAVGAVVLFIFNLVAGFFGFALGINAVTALIVGFMGLPGLIMLIVVQKMLG